MLAALDNNNNTGREQYRTLSATEKGLKVKSHFRIAYRKSSKKMIARKFYTRKEYHYLKIMMDEARKNAAVGLRNTCPTKRKIMAPSTRDSRNDLIAKCQKFSRFK